MTTKAEKGNVGYQAEWLSEEGLSQICWSGKLQDLQPWRSQEEEDEGD